MSEELSDKELVNILESSSNSPTESNVMSMMSDINPNVDIEKITQQVPVISTIIYSIQDTKIDYGYSENSQNDKQSNSPR